MTCDHSRPAALYINKRQSRTVVRSESVASGRLLISTRVPGEGLNEMLQGVVFVDDVEERQLEAVLDARATFYSRSSAVESGAALTRSRFSTRAFAEKVQAILTTSLRRLGSQYPEPSSSA